MAALPLGAGRAPGGRRAPSRRGPDAQARTRCGAPRPSSHDSFQRSFRWPARCGGVFRLHRHTGAGGSPRQWRRLYRSARAGALRSGCSPGVPRRDAAPRRNRTRLAAGTLPPQAGGRTVRFRARECRRANPATPCRARGNSSESRATPGSVGCGREGAPIRIEPQLDAAALRPAQAGRSGRFRPGHHLSSRPRSLTSLRRSIAGSHRSAAEDRSFLAGWDHQT